MLKINNVKKPNGFKVLIPVHPVNVKPRNQGNLACIGDGCRTGNGCPPVNSFCVDRKNKPGF